ncbi:hypothetical protein D9758_008250 [Tetrapyrgos nigripes]|uniref:F-box domain-containing protein n=1 Tax=Tetrapyrgos nigripes TaxID=182062 RepID=A0A8H5G1K3_9AGAR|nr:hypothetical protein D9758_008250 [Tetrapyrgos nigripes]
MPNVAVMTTADRAQLKNMDYILFLLRSNLIPSALDVSQCLTDTGEDLKPILDEINQLERRLSSLRDVRRGLELRASRYRSLLSPIRRLPPELLSYVFEFACADPALIGSYLRSFPVQISQVCTSWRNLARSTPKLWSLLEICPFRFRSFSIEQMSLFLTMHLELSKSFPLYLTVDLRDISKQVGSPIIHLLTLHSVRWRIVSLVDIGLFEEELSVIKGKLPLLHTLILKSRLSDNFDAFEIAPNLRAFTSIYGWYFKLRLPWNQIRTYRVVEDTVGSIGRELFLVKEATEVLLDDCSPPRDLDPPLIHNLRSLSIVVYSHNPDFGIWFKSLTLPRLASLTIKGADQWTHPVFHQDFAHNGLRSFLSRSSCIITSLSLIEISVSDVDVISLLSALPSLSSLTIHEREYYENTTFTTHLLEYLVADSDDAPPDSRTELNHLQTLDFRLHGTVPATSLVRVIESRWSRNREDTSIVDSLSMVNIMVLRSHQATTLDVEELHASLNGMGVPFSCSSKFLQHR